MSNAVSRRVFSTMVQECLSDLFMALVKYLIRSSTSHYYNSVFNQLLIQPIQVSTHTGKEYEYFGVRE